MKNQAHRSVVWALVMLAALWVGNNVQGQNLAVEQEAKRQPPVVRSQKDTRLSAAAWRVAAGRTTAGTTD